MNIYMFSNDAHKAALQEEFIGHFQRKSLVPFLGSGFSYGLIAKRGSVPGVAALRNHICELIAQIENYTEEETDELQHLNLSDLAEMFWPLLEKSEAVDIKEEFETYMNDRFTEVSDINDSKRRFANSEWRYIYTLNYDDAVESATNRKLMSIFPYECQSGWAGHQKRIIKLHGDARQYAKTGNNRYCILSPKQYLDAMTDSENRTMMDNLRTDFASNNILFVGCSLISELDLLFSASFKLEEAKKNNKMTHCYYVRYTENGDKALSPVMILRLEQYGITDVIEVTANEMDDFYLFVARVSDIAKQLRASDDLSQYTGAHFATLDPLNTEKNIRYLYYSSEILPNDKNEIVTPSFFQRREITDIAIRDIYRGLGNVLVFRGNRLSGKTYVLIDVLKEFRAGNTYFFSRKSVPDECFSKLLEKKNSLLIFDEKTLSLDQINKLSRDSRKRTLKKNNIRIVIAVDRSLGLFTKHYYDQYPENKEYVKIYDIPSTFSEKELDKFNDTIGNLGLKNRTTEQTFLDYMFSLSDDAVNKEHNLLPPVNVVGDINALKILILLAHQETVYLSQGARMRLIPDLIHLQEKASAALQLDYLTEIELSHLTHDTQRYVSNSQYWVYKCLANYAHGKSHYKIIAQAYYDIVESIQRYYGAGYEKRNAKKYRQAIKPYYFLDTIQFTFFSLSEDGGSLLLANIIYDKLQPLFKNEYQFLHQKAKCLLWTSKHEEDETNRHKLLEQAGYLINRASQIARQFRPANLEFTLFHMDITRALIMANNWRYCRGFMEGEKSEYLSKVIAHFFAVTSSEEFTSGPTDDDMNRREMEDFKWFVTDLMAGESSKLIYPRDRLMAQRIINLTRDSGYFTFS